MSRADLKLKLDKHTKWADELAEDLEKVYKVGDFIHPINFLVGVSNSLLRQLEKSERTLKTSFISLQEQLAKSKENYQRRVDLSNRQKDLITKYQQVLYQLDRTRFIWKTKALKAELESMRQMEMRHGIKR